MSCARRLIPVTLLILALLAPHIVRAARATVAPLASADPLFPPSAPFQFPDLGTYNGGVYVRHERGAVYYTWVMRPAGFSPSSSVGVDYFVNIFPNAGQAQASNAHSRQVIEGAVSQFAHISPFAFEGTGLSDPSLSAWGGDTPSIHCNSSLGFVFRNITFSVSFSSHGGEVCKTGSDWPVGLALRLLQASIVFAHTHAGVAVPSYPPLSYFHLPVNVVGAPPVPYSPVPQERSDQATFERCNDYRVHVAVLCQNYVYDVIPNVSNAGQVGPNGGQPRQGAYIVSMYDTTDQARQDNAYERAYGGGPNGPDEQPLPLLTIAHPVDSNTEWMRGHVINGPTGPEGCDVSGGIRYRNVKISDGVYVLFATRPHGTTSCQASYDWVTRVLAALYARAATVNTHHTSSVATHTSRTTTHAPAVAPVLRGIVPALERAHTVPIYLPSWLPNFGRRVYPLVSISKNQWSVQLYTNPHFSSLADQVWFVQGFAGVQLRTDPHRLVSIGANGVGYLYLNKGSNGAPDMEWTRNGNTYNAGAITINSNTITMETSPDQPTLVRIVRSMVRVSQDTAPIATRKATPARPATPTAVPQASAPPPIDQQARAQVRVVWDSIIKATAPCQAISSNLLHYYQSYLKGGPGATSGIDLQGFAQAAITACQQTIQTLAMPPNNLSPGYPEYARLMNMEYMANRAADAAMTIALAITGRVEGDNQDPGAGASYDPMIRHAYTVAMADFRQELTIANAIATTWRF